MALVVALALGSPRIHQVRIILLVDAVGTTIFGVSASQPSHPSTPLTRELTPDQEVLKRRIQGCRLIERPRRPRPRRRAEVGSGTATIPAASRQAWSMPVGNHVS